MKVRLQIIILITIGFYFSGHAEENSSITNLNIFKNLYYKGFSKAFQKITVFDSLTLYFNHLTKNKNIDWLIEEQFIKSANNAGFFNLIQIDDSTFLKNEKSYMTEFHSVLNKVNYYPMSILPENKHNRKVTIEFYLKILSSGNQVLLSNDIKETYSDTIFVNKIKYIENTNFPFTIGNRSKSLVSKLFEPLLVSLITSTVIYIFYSFRSN